MKNFYYSILLTTLVVSSTGCSYLSPKYNLTQQRQTEYLKAHATQPLQIPAGMIKTNVQDTYPIPNANTAAPTQTPSLLPPNSMAEQIQQGKLSPNTLQTREALKEITTAPTNTNDPNAISYVKNDTLILNQSINDAWEQVGNAINKAGYKLAYKNPRTFIYYILDIYSTNGNVTRTTPIYQIHLNTRPLGVEISVTDNTGKQVSTEIANRILDNLYRELPKASVKTAKVPSVMTQGATPNSAPTTNFGRLMQNLFPQ